MWTKEPPTKGKFAWYWKPFFVQPVLIEIDWLHQSTTAKQAGLNGGSTYHLSELDGLWHPATPPPLPEARHDDYCADKGH